MNARNIPVCSSQVRASLADTLLVGADTIARAFFLFRSIAIGERLVERLKFPGIFGFV